MKYVKVIVQTLKEVQGYQKEVKRNEKKLEGVEIECQRRIRSVRSFWKDKIYRETTRTGRIVKYAMQKTSHAY